MKRRFGGVIAFLLLLAPLMAGCNLLTPDLALRVVNPSYSSISGNNVRISFQLYNSGSERLQNCKVKWYVDDYDGGALSDSDIEYDEITSWTPVFGVDLSPGETSNVRTVDTTSGIFAGGVNFYGIYEMGWNYSDN